MPGENGPTRVAVVEESAELAGLKDEAAVFAPGLDRNGWSRSTWGRLRIMGFVEPRRCRRCDVTGLDTSPIVAAFVERAVMRSFDTRPLPVRRITQGECRRRVKVCERIWRQLRIEKKWSVQRACDTSTAT